MSHAAAAVDRTSPASDKIAILRALSRSRGSMKTPAAIVRRA
jgi:hypothetical protein